MLKNLRGIVVKVLNGDIRVSDFDSSLVITFSFLYLSLKYEPSLSSYS